MLVPPEAHQQTLGALDCLLDSLHEVIVLTHTPELCLHWFCLHCRVSLGRGLRLTTPPACLHSLPPSQTTVRFFLSLGWFHGTFSAGVLQDSGGRYAVYHVHVKCQHTQVPVVEEWVTKRRYSDFHDLHLTLRTQVSSLSLSGEDRWSSLLPPFISGGQCPPSACTPLLPQAGSTAAGGEERSTTELPPGACVRGLPDSTPTSARTHHPVSFTRNV